MHSASSGSAMCSGISVLAAGHDRGLGEGQLAGYGAAPLRTGSLMPGMLVHVTSNAFGL